MNLFVAIFVFFLTLGMTVKTLAKDPSSETCTAAEATTCADEHKKSGGHHGGHGDLDAKMNSLFPEKQASKSLSQRPAQVQLQSPAFRAKVPGTEVQLSWQSVSGADTYHLQVATDPNFKWLVINDAFVKEPVYNFASAQAGTRYFWRVASWNSKNDSGYTKSNFSTSHFETK
jgi:hypothetical protein